MRGRWVVVVGVVGALLGAQGAQGAVGPPAADGPGALSHFGLARKDCVGTARNRESKVWFTVANGVLSDVHFPTNDTTNVETMQYVVTDGRTFTDLQTRDMTYTVRSRDARVPSCRVTATAKSGRYRIVTDYLTDLSRDAVVTRARLEPLKRGVKVRDLKLYVRFDPTLNGNGGGGDGNGGPDGGAVLRRDGHDLLIGSDPVTQTNAPNRDYAVPVYAALDADRPFRAVSNGFAGAASDGLTQLDAAHRLTDPHASTSAPGNLVQTAQVDLGRDGAFTLALGFGTSADAAARTTRGSLRTNPYAMAAKYALGWLRYDAGLRRPDRPRGVSRREWGAILDEYYISANYVKIAEDKTFPGAVGAAMASPWGQAVSAGDPNQTYFGSYREVFARDLYQAWTALWLAGDRATARDMTRFLFERQQLPDGSMPRNSLTNGKLAPDSFGTQLDECAYPIVMALAVGLTDGAYYRDHIKPAADFVIAHGPAYGNERWEEQGGYSPSTIAAEVVGLVAAGEIAAKNGDVTGARIYRGYADELQRNVKAWTLTTNGPRSSDPYFIRLSKTGDPNAAISYNVGNGGPTLDQRDVIDAGFLEYVRLGLLPADDADVVRSLAVVDDAIRVSTATGEGFYRYNGDGYGDRSSNGRPWPPSNQGNGHLWPVLAGERGQWELARGDVTGAVSRLGAMMGTASGVGLIPEQAWELPDLAASPFGTDPTQASIGFENGKAAGSASALTWSAGQFVRLTLDLAAGRQLDTPSYVASRYVARTQGETPLTVTSPDDRSPVSGGVVTVTGTTAPGNAIAISASNVDDDNKTTQASGVAGDDGAFSVDVAVTGGTSVLNVVATAPDGATGRELRTVVYDFVPGTLIASFDDPDGDDHGPGTFAYPTAGDFHDGAYDLQQFQVYDDGDDVVFRARVRDLTPTFGSALGAQLLDVYVHDPGAASTSTGSAYATRNYTIAPSGAWSRLIEVQGFGQLLRDASGAAVGTAAISANEISRYITFSVPKATLGGTPAAGWGFSVVLHGQDGFSPDQARGFQPVPQDYQFGVCAPGGSAPLCSVDPGTVPKAMDVLTPAGVDQADELDPLAGPVEIAPVVIGG
ncbi:glucodextranase DOMON-like domain-containing protein [Baekduia sp. Peel2402]|uniref:glucodextranase DOMON-like domain-containing protein n=1 Tax=Baekduia sp. Peel2402 TaxID=3458296 RepID=UPI00403EC4F1